MSVDATVRHIFGYDGSAKTVPPLQLIDESTIVYVSGHTLQFTCTSSGRQHFLLRSQPRQLVAFDCSWKTSTFAIATRELHAPISLYSFPDKKLLNQLRSSDAQHFEYSLVKFSYCGRRLLSIRPTLPGGDNVATGDDSVLCVWDIDTLAPVPGCEHASVCGHPRFASFDPANNNQLVLGGDRGLDIWKVYPGNTTALSLLRPKTVTRPDFSKGASEVASDVDLDEKRMQCSCHAWLPHSQLLVADQAGELLLVDATEARVVQVVKSATRANRCCIVGIVGTKETVVVVYADGAIAWLQLDSWDLVHTETLASGCRVTAVAPTPSYAKAYVGTLDGKIFAIRTNNLQDNGDDFDVEEHQRATPESARSQPKLGLDCIVPCASFPVGPVCDSTVLTPFGGSFSTDALLATGGLSGILTLWNLRDCHQAAEVNIAELFARNGTTSATTLSQPETALLEPSCFPLSSVKIISLASRPGDPIIMVGDYQGRLRSLCIAKMVDRDDVEVLPQHLMQLLRPDAPLDLVALHPTHSVLLVASTHSGQVLLVAMDYEKRYPVQAFFTFNDPDERVVDIQWTATINKTLTLTCFTSRGRFYSAHYDPSSQDEQVTSQGALQLHPNVIASGQASVSTYTNFRVLATFSSTLMVATSPHHPDLIVLKYADELHDATDDMSVLSRVLIKQAHARGISAVALFPRVLRNESELLVTGGMDGSLTFWTLTTASTRHQLKQLSGSDTESVDEWQALQATKKRTLVIHKGPVTTLRFVVTNGERSATSHDLTKIQLISTGVDGCVFLLDVRLSADLLDEPVLLNETQSLDPIMNPLYMNVVATAKENDMYWLEQEHDRTPFLEARTCAETITSHDSLDRSKDITRRKLRELEEQLEGLLAENEELPDTEQLARDEFVLDVARQNRLLSQRAARAEQVRQEITRDVARMIIVRERMKREFWDETEVCGVCLIAFSPSEAQQPVQSNGSTTPLFVNNFPLRRQSLSEQKLAKQIATLRLVELAHQKDEPYESPSFARFRNTVPSDLQWILNADSLHLKVPHEAEVVGNNDEYVQKPSSCFLYHPAAVRTWKQARVQMHLIRCYAREQQRAYNVDFERYVRQKETTMEQIEAKNTRIVEIMTELHGNADAGDLFRPQWSPEEKAESILNVLPEEMTQNEDNLTNCRPHHEQESQDAVKQKKSRGNDDSGERALMDMMDGTLEVRKDPLAAQELVKEPWMVMIPPDEMTIEQKKLVEQFEAAKTKFEDEREKYRKSLDLELRKTRADVLELCRTFDDKLGVLHARYMTTQRAVLSQELYELRLGEEVRRREDLKLAMTRLEDEARLLQAAETRAQADCDRFAMQLEACREDFYRASEEDKLLDKNFMRDFEDLARTSEHGGGPLIASTSQLESPDFLKHIVELYRKRKPNDLDAVAFHQDAAKRTMASTRAKGSAKGRLLAQGHSDKRFALAKTASSNNNLANTHGNLDPFQDLDTHQRDSTKREHYSKKQTLVVAPLDYSTDRPNGILIEDRLWRALNALRTKKILAEHAVRERSDVLALAKTVNDELRSHLCEVQRQCKTQQRERETLTRQYTALTESIPLLVRMKQGQDECPVDSNRDDALLVSRTSVEALNEEIQVHGNDQVGILNRIKDFRKRITVMEWEHALLVLQTRDMNERYTDIQLLRVTNDLQELLHTGDTSHKQKRQTLMLEAKLTHLSRNHEAMLLKLDRTGSHLTRQLRERERENTQLEQQVAHLATQVQVREDIVASRINAAVRQQAAGIGARSDASRLKAITVRRKLVDLTKAQTNEIEYLRLELEKMRRRTFPSFAQVHARNSCDVDLKDI